MTGFLFGGGGSSSAMANVMNYGAINDGTGDNSTAFYNAIAAAGAVFVPSGTYNFTKGIDVDALGGNGSFTLQGVGSSTLLQASMDDFIFRKVLRNTGSVSSCRSIRDMKFSNTQTSLASPVTNISNISWGTIVGGNLAGQTGVTVTATAHNFTVGSSRLMLIAGIVSGGLDCNGLVGCYFNDANHFQYMFDAGNPGSYVSGGTYAPRGGAISMIGYIGGCLYNVNFGGYYGFYGERDCTVDLVDCAALGPGSNVGIGITTAGQCGIYGCDVTGWETGIAMPASALGVAIAGGRIEINTTGISCNTGSYVHISGLTMEYNITGISFLGSGLCTISSVQIHGSTGGRGTSGSGLYFYGANNNISAEQVSIYGDFSGAAIYYDTPATSRGIRFKNVNLSVTGGGGVNSVFPVNTVCPQWESCINVTTASERSTFANRPSSSYALAGETWIFTDCAATAVATCSLGTITGNTTFTVAGVLTGSYQVGDILSGTNVTAGTTITAISGAGTYTCTSSTNASATTITGSRVLPNVAIAGGGTSVVVGRFDGTNWYVVCKAG